MAFCQPLSLGSDLSIFATFDNDLVAKTQDGRLAVRLVQRHFASEMLRVPISNMLGGTSFETTTDAPITEPAPILTPGMIVQRAPIQAPFPTSMGADPVA
jgi:hypothetical protein